MLKKLIFNRVITSMLRSLPSSSERNPKGLNWCAYLNVNHHLVVLLQCLWQLLVRAMWGLATTWVTAPDLGREAVTLGRHALRLPSACAPHSVLKVVSIIHTHQLLQLMLLYLSIELKTNIKSVVQAHNVHKNLN